MRRKQKQERRAVYPRKGRELSAPSTKGRAKNNLRRYIEEERDR